MRDSSSELPDAPAGVAALPSRLCAAAASRIVFGIVIFASAFLLFQIEPLIAKILLPRFGGAAEVWIVCLLFFQVVLLLGYWYADVLARRMPARTQGRIHASLLAASVVALPMLLGSARRHGGAVTGWTSGNAAMGDPVFQILTVLAITVGLPYF